MTDYKGKEDCVHRLRKEACFCEWIAQEGLILRTDYTRRVLCVICVCVVFMLVMVVVLYLCDGYV